MEEIQIVSIILDQANCQIKMMSVQQINDICIQKEIKI